MNNHAFVTFIIRNDSYLPGALVFAYALKLQNTDADLICIISDNISKYAESSLRVFYDDVIRLDELYVKHNRRHERQDRPFLFTRFNALRLGKNGDLNKKYEKIIIADCDLLPLRKYDSLFDLTPPAGIINEKKEHCMEYTDGTYIKPNSVYTNGTWNWHTIYKDVPHGTLIPKHITDRVHTDKENMGVNASLYVFKPSMKLYNDILDDISKEETKQEISTYNWPEMQYITQKLSGKWTNIDLRYSSFNGYPEIDVIYGTHFAGLKPWSFNNKSVYNFAKFDDYKLWYHTYIKMCKAYPSLLNNKKLKRLNNKIKKLLIKDKYQFYKDYLPQLKHFFN
ncbi:MAG: hypothetical protein K9L74_03770 [Candidatus Izimaplasma sp.]|nr:hypothetical protein [Candidatus Izimaplasma bacterium]